MTTEQSHYPNRDAIRRCLDLYLDTMQPFVVRIIQRNRGYTVRETIYGALSEVQARAFEDNVARAGGRVEVALDIGLLTRIITFYWNGLFREPFKSSATIRTSLNYLRDMRNVVAHRASGDPDDFSTLTLLHHLVDVMEYANDPDRLMLVQKEQASVLDRCLSSRQGERSSSTHEALQRARELEQAAIEKMRYAEELAATSAEARRLAEERENALNNLNEAVTQVERIAAERSAAVAEHEVAVAEHAEAIAEHEAAVADLEAAIFLLDSANTEDEAEAATEAIRQAEELEAAANEREAAANATEAASNLREEAANSYRASSSEHQALLEQAGTAVSDAMQRALALGESAMDSVRQAEEREATAQETLRRAEEREIYAEMKESDFDRRELDADTRKARADRRRSTVPSSLTPANLSQVWNDVVAGLGRTRGQKHFLGPLLKDCRVEDIRTSEDGSKLMLPVKSVVIGRMLAEELSYSDVRQKVEEFLEESFGRRYDIEIIR